MGYSNLYTPMMEKRLYIFRDKSGERTYINKRLYILLLRISKNIFLLRDKKERKDIWIKWSVLQMKMVNLLFSKEKYRVNRKRYYHTRT